MKKLIFVLLLALPAAAFAQVFPAAVSDNVIDDAAVSAHVRALGNSVNNKVIVFYEAKNADPGLIDIRIRYVSETGVQSGVYTVASNIDASGLWDVCWHPDAKRYLIVYRKDEALLAQLVRANGRPKGKPKKIADYAGTTLQATWTGDNRFIVFYTDDAWLSAQTLRKNAKVHLPAVHIAGGELNGEAYPVEAETDTDGTAICYYGLYTSLEQNKLTPSLVKIDSMLQVVDQFALVDPIVVSSKETFRAVNDPGSGNQMIAWQFQTVGAAPSDLGTPMYAVIKENGGAALEPASIPDGRTPLDLAWSPVSERFTLLFSWDEEVEGVATVNYAQMVFRPNGTLVSPGTLILSENRGTPVSVDGDFANNGNYLLLYSLEEEAITGVFARFFY